MSFSTRTLPSSSAVPMSPRSVTDKAAAVTAPAPAKKSGTAILFQHPILVGAISSAGLLFLILFGITLGWLLSGSPPQTAANSDEGSSTAPPTDGEAPEAPRASGGGSLGTVKSSLNNLKQLALALHNYHDTYRMFPLAVQLGPKDVPHSWRVSILPFIEPALYDQYRMDEPWDSPSNQKVLAQMPDVYLSPGTLQTERITTNYVGFSLPPSSGPMDPAKLPVLGGTRGGSLLDIRDGAANVILLVETKMNIPWTKPADVPFDPHQPLPKFGGVHPGGFCAAMSDASATFFPDTYEPAMLLRCILRGDGEPVQVPHPPDVPRPKPPESAKMERPAAPPNPIQASMSNLKRITLAFHNYHDTLKTFPSAVQIGPKNVPHSWRVAILPFMDQQELYDAYRLDEPWDSPHNRALLSRMPDVYRAPHAPRNAHSASYFGFTPSGHRQTRDYAMRQPVLAGNQTHSIPSIVDGTSHVIMVVESKLEIPWTQPRDIPWDLQQPLPKLGGIHPGGFVAAMCNGSTHFIPDDYDRDLLLRLIQPADGEPVPLPEEVAQRKAAIRERQTLAASSRPADRRAASMANLRQIGLALHNYHDVFKTMPPAVQIGPKNVPHSWRVAILPYLDHRSLYRKYRLDEPWDSPHNKGLLNEMPYLYRAPGSRLQSTNTGYFGFSLPEAAHGAPTSLPLLAGTKYTHFAQALDGLDNTLLVVETRLDVPWTQPLDILFDPSSPSPPTFGGVHDGGFFGVMGNGRSLFFPDSFEPSMLLRILKRGDGERVVLPPFE